MKKSHTYTHSSQLSSPLYDEVAAAARKRRPSLRVPEGHDPEAYDDAEASFRSRIEEALADFCRDSQRARKLYEAEHAGGRVTRDICEIWDARVGDACWDLGIERTCSGLLDLSGVEPSPEKEWALRVIEAENRRPYRRRKARVEIAPRPRHLRLV